MTKAERTLRRLGLVLNVFYVGVLVAVVVTTIWRSHEPWNTGSALLVGAIVGMAGLRAFGDWLKRLEKRARAESEH